MQKIIKNILLIVLIVSFGFVSIRMEAQKFQKYIFLDGNDTLPYNMLIPEGYLSKLSDNPESKNDAIKYPLVLFLHGAGERGNDNEIQIIHIKNLYQDSLNLKKYPAFVIAPQCPKGKRWVESSWKVSKHIMPTNPSISIVLTIKLIDSLIANLPIDSKRIYVTGLSMGGFGTWDLICRYPVKFAAAIPICGGGDISKAKIIKNIPVWVFHGSNDKVVKVNLSRDLVKALKAIGGKPKYTEYQGVGHDSWVKAFKEKELLEWLFKQSQ
jgi:predicted peptidase